MSQACVIAISTPIYLEKILAGFRSCTQVPDLVVFVLDRCGDHAKVITQGLDGTNINYLVLQTRFTDNIFAAGRPRDFGIDYIMHHRPDITSIVFLDGDCVPSPLLFQEHRRIQTQAGKYPCLVNSMRINQGEDNTEVSDSRISNPCVFSTGKDIVTVFDKHLYVDDKMYPACVGCNISLNMSAITLAKQINQRLLGVSRVFAHVFDGQWGGEDPYLSATLFRAGALLVNANPAKSSVLHLYHTGAHRNNAHVRSLTQALNKFNAYSMSGSLILQHTLIECSDSSSHESTIRTSTDIHYPQITRLAYRKLETKCANEIDKWLAVLCASRVYTTIHSVSRTLKMCRPYKEFMTLVQDTSFDLQDFQGLNEYDSLYWTDIKDVRKRFVHNTYGMFR
jgi:hypothetical protein